MAYLVSPRRSTLACGLARVVLISACIFAPPAAAARCQALQAPDSPFQAALRAAVDVGGAPGVTAIVFGAGGQSTRIDIGEIDRDQALMVASASKWITAALVMTAVDDGQLDLDAPISAVLPELPPEQGEIRLRQLLSFTAGHADLRSAVELRQPATITLGQSAQLIAQLPLQHRPGTTFGYGGASMQIAGAMLERVTGQRWATLFAERIAQPLGMRDSEWLHPVFPGVPASETSNPVLQGGLRTTATDYARFLDMIAGRGVHRGKRILSVRAIREMERDQIGDAAIGYLPPGAAGKDLRYGLGQWCERPDPAHPRRGCRAVSSPGLTGTYPWIDREAGVHGLFFLDAPYARVEPLLNLARAAAVDACGRHPH